MEKAVDFAGTQTELIELITRLNGDLLLANIPCMFYSDFPLRGGAGRVTIGFAVPTGGKDLSNNKGFDLAHMWGDSVVPLSMKLVALDLDGRHLFIRYLAPSRIPGRVQHALDRQSRRGACRRDQAEYSDCLYLISSRKPG